MDKEMCRQLYLPNVEDGWKRLYSCTLLYIIYIRILQLLSHFKGSLLLIPNVDLVSAIIDVIKPANFIGRSIVDLQPFQMHGQLTLHKTWT